MPVITHANAPPGYVLPSELTKPVPRRIRLRAGHSLFVIWTVRLLLLPFGAIGAYFIRYLIDNAQQGDIWFLIIVGFYVLAWNAIWGLFFYVLVIAAWLERRLCRWGTPVPGRILKKCEEKGSK